MLTALISMAVMGSPAAIKTQTVEYKDGDTPLTGYLAEPSHLRGKMPAIMIVHQWMGLTDYEKMRARMLANLGYIAFACDIYGTGMRPKDMQAAGELSGKYKGDRPLYRQRLNAGFDEMKSFSHVDPDQMGAIGYCFGGTGVVELARSGANAKAIVTFHGGLDSPNPTDGANIKGKVLICAGADDPFEKPSDLAAFKDEMAKNNVDMKYIAYPGAVHAFTQPMAGNDPSKGMAYNEEADHQSWDEMKGFLGGIFKM